MSLRVLCVDDEQPAVDELAYLLGQDDRIAEVHTCTSATQALASLKDNEYDAVFLDIQMPALDGLELAAVLSRFRTPPAVVFVTAHDEHAVAAFDLRAVDYVLKPVRADRIAETVGRLTAGSGATTAAPAATAGPEDLQIAVDLAGVTRFVRRSEITHVEAQGDYARLHTPAGSHLVRTPLTQLEEEWADAGFARIHRSLLVNLARVTAVRTEAGRCTVVVDSTTELGVARCHVRPLKDRLAARSR